jgi:heme-degrading monooxygenase HmoA
MIPRHTVREISVGRLQPEQSMKASFEEAVATELHARVVEFIAKPEKADELRGLLCQAVTPLLRDQTGFIRSIVLTKHEEPRRIVVITFWSTEERTISDPWEESPIVREILSPLIDAWTRTRTYQADLTETTEAHCEATSLPIC